jgi:hypothetical protein
MFRTIKEAKAAGYTDVIYAYEYGGERITVKGKEMAKGLKTAQSVTEWKRLGFQVKPGEVPHARRCVHFGKAVTFCVYRDDQVIRVAAERPRRRRRPAMALLSQEDRIREQILEKQIHDWEKEGF